MQLFFLWVFIGYGYKIWYAGIWSLGLIVVGFLWLRAVHQGPKVKQRGPIEDQKEGPLADLFYSIDLFLPIIELRKSHYDIDLTGSARYYFYFHQLMGYVLATFLVADLSGLAG